MIVPDIRHIYFDEAKHEYTDEFGNKYTSVTTAIHKLVEPFKKNYWAKKKALELGTNPELLKAQWKNVNSHSLNVGNKKHNRFEASVKETSMFHKAVRYIKTGDRYRCFSIPDLNKDDEIGLMDINKFYNDIGYKYELIFRTIEFYVSKGYKIYSEINVYDPINLISGLVDILLVKGDDFVIIDWKTNRNDIAFESGYYKKDKKTNELTDRWIPMKKYMFYPVDHIQDCTGNHYNLQLSMYADMIEQFGYTCRALILFHIRDTFVLNQYGMPKKDERGIYIVDREKPERVNYHVMTYYKNEARAIREYVGNKNISNQKQLIF